MSALADMARQEPLPGSSSVAREANRSDTGVGMSTPRKVAVPQPLMKTPPAPARPETAKTQPERTETHPTKDDTKPASPKPERVEASAKKDTPTASDNDVKSSETNPAGKTDKTEKAANSDDTAAATPTSSAIPSTPETTGEAAAMAAMMTETSAENTESVENPEVAPTETLMAPVETASETEAAAQLPVDTQTQEALTGQIPATAKAPALDGETLRQDIGVKVSVATSEAPVVSGLSGADTAALDLPVSTLHEVPVANPGATDAASEALATASQAIASAGTNTTSATGGAANTGTSISSVSGVSGTAAATTPAASAAPAQAPAASAPAQVTQAAPVYAPNLSQQVFDQMQHQLSRLRTLGTGMHQLKLAIKPEAFGSVRVAVNFQADGSVQLQLLGANDAAREQLRQILGDLRRDLASTGLQAQLDLAESDEHFAQFTQTGGEDSRSGAGSENGPRGQEAGGVNTQEELANSTPRVGDVLKDGSDGSVDMFA